MKLLAIECATERCSAALWLEGEVMHLHHDGTQQRNSESLLPMVSSLLKEADLRLPALDVIAFGAGPGAFTGLRVACGVAQGLAFGAGLPVLPVGTLEVLAEGMKRCLPPQAEPLRCLAVLDARMGEVYAAEFLEQDQDWVMLSGPELSRPESIHCDAVADPLFGIGNAFPLYHDQWVERLGTRLKWVESALQVPDAIPLARLAARRFPILGGLPPEEAHPVYIRDKVALTSLERGQS